MNYNNTLIDLSFEKAIEILSHTQLEKKIREIPSKSFQYSMICMCVRMVQSLIIMKKWYFIDYRTFSIDMLEILDDFIKTLDNNITQYYQDMIENRKTIRDIYQDIQTVEVSMNITKVDA
jgi:hypothetical protein